MIARAAALGGAQRAAPAAAPPMPWPCSPGSTPKSESPQTPSRTSASATPTISPSSSATHAPAGSRSRRWRDPDRGRARLLGARRRVGGLELGGVERLERRAADGRGAGTSSGGMGRVMAVAGTAPQSTTPRGPAGGAVRASATLRRRPWPSPSKSSRTAARPSAARSTRSARPRSTRARSATARAGRTGSARRAAPTPAARSSRPTPSTTRPRRTRSMAPRRAPTPPTIVVAVDANGADLGPAEVAAGAAIAARAGRPRAAVRPGRRARRASRPTGVEVVDAPVSIAKAPDPVARRARRPRTPRSCRPRGPSPTGARRRARLPAARPAPRSPPGLLQHQARAAASTARRSRSRCRSRGAAR